MHTEYYYHILLIIRSKANKELSLRMNLKKEKKKKTKNNSSLIFLTKISGSLPCLSIHIGCHVGGLRYF